MAYSAHNDPKLCGENVMTKLFERFINSYKRVFVELYTAREL